MSEAAPTELSLLDVLQAEKWSAALFTTFPLSLSFFEAAPLIKLRTANCRQITVLADVMGYGASTQERGAVGAGRSYELRPVLVPGGCFHPKLSLFVGPDGPRALVGSGNLTFTGWTKNLEFADYLSPQHSGQATRDVGAFLETLVSSPRVNADFGDLDPFIDACAKTPATGSTRVLHDLERPIVEALFDAVVDNGGARAIRVVSPFFGNGDGLLQLADLLEVDDVGVFVCGKTREAFPFAKATGAGIEIKRLGSPLLDPHDRPLHGKAIEVETKSGRRILLTGSVNATRHALLEGSNVELAVLRVLDGPSRYGWTPSTLNASIEASVETWNSAGQPVLTASLEHDGVIVGRILALSVEPGAWRATFVQGVRRAELAAADVAADGSFTLAAEGLGQIAAGRRGATQLELTRGALTVCGWILLSDYLAAVREYGGFADAALQVIDGTADAGAIEAVLEFFARNAVALPHQSTSGSSEEEKPPKELLDQTISPASLAPQSIESATARGPSEARSAAERLLAALRIAMLRSSTGGHGGENETDSGDEDNPDRTKTTKARREFFDRFLDAYDRRIAQGLSEPGRRHDLMTLLGVIRYCAPRVEEAEVRMPELQRRWLHLAAAHTDATTSRYDTLEVEFALAVIARVIEARQSAAGAHGDLQRRWSGAVPEDLGNAFISAIDEGASVHWSATTTPAAWRAAWVDTLAARTQWQNAMSLLAAARAGRVPDPVEGFSDHIDLPLLRIAAAAGTLNGRLVETKSLPGGRAVCPCCYMLMNAQVSDRLRRTRLVRCDGRRCGRFVVHVGP